MPARRCDRRRGRQRAGRNVVVLNRCTDDTEAIAVAHGATVVQDATRCLSAVRNRGAGAASGDIIVTCDADSRLHPAMLGEVIVRLETGAVGGGTALRYDRRSLGIAATEFALRCATRTTGLSCAALWTTRRAFDAIGGFDERRLMAEDTDFAQRLRRYGRAHGLRYDTLHDTPVLTSARKFDRYGDWSLFTLVLRDGGRIRRSLAGRDTDFVDEYFYDFDENHTRSAPHSGKGSSTASPP